MKTDGKIAVVAVVDMDGVVTTIVVCEVVDAVVNVVAIVVVPVDDCDVGPVDGVFGDVEG